MSDMSSVLLCHRSGRFSFNSLSTALCICAEAEDWESLGAQKLHICGVWSPVCCALCSLLWRPQGSGNLSRTIGPSSDRVR